MSRTISRVGTEVLATLAFVHRVPPPSAWVWLDSAWHRALIYRGMPDGTLLARLDDGRDGKAEPWQWTLSPWEPEAPAVAPKVCEACEGRGELAPFDAAEGTRTCPTCSGLGFPKVPITTCRRQLATGRFVLRTRIGVNL